MKNVLQIRQAVCLLPLTLLLAFLTPIRSYAQSSSHSGRLEGTVVDPSGALIPGATVQILNESTGLGAETIANGEGHFIFPALEPGEYQVTVSANQLGQATLGHVVVNVGTTANLRAELTVAAAHEETTVTAARRSCTAGLARKHWAGRPTN